MIDNDDVSLYFRIFFGVSPFPSIFTFDSLFAAIIASKAIILEGREIVSRNMLPNNTTHLLRD